MSKPLPRYREDTDPNKLDRILAQSTPLQTPATTSHATLPGDNRRLRGIPVVGSTSGTSPGTDPHQALVTKQRYQAKRCHRA